MKLEDELKTKFQSELQKSFLNIIYTGSWLHNKVEGILKPFNLSHQQYNVLRILRGKHPGQLNLQDISERMIDRMSNATRLVEKLRMKGLLTREICPENRRKVEIKITEKGLKLLSALDEVIKKGNEAILSKITEAEALDLNNYLDRVRS